MKKLVAPIMAACIGLFAHANAAVINVSIPDFSSDGVPPFPNAPLEVGTFNFSLSPGESIISAVLSGTFGNADFEFSTAPLELYADGGFVAECFLGDPCESGSSPLTPWSFTFADFTDLLDGSLVLTVIQTNENIVRLGNMTLTIETDAAPVPLPAALPLMVMGLGGIAAIRRRKRSA